MLRLYDTAIGSVEPLELRQDGELSMYICGPTVYGEPHAGHGRACLVWDMLRRYAEWRGLKVKHVSNVTDIDDKIINRARAEETTEAEVAKTWETAWWDAMGRLGIARPHETPHATEYVEQMVAFIAGLVDRGKAYVGGDGVYFSSETVADYGLLPHRTIDVLREGETRLEGVDESGKRSSMDFVLWKFAKPGEPTWAAPWGAGRPGWHTECVVMSVDLLGDAFDVHGGGIDLIFPHHEDERAQAVAAGETFSRRWMHHEMVVTEGGVKMSKSLGNFLSLADLLERYDDRAYRLLALQTHYRKTMTVSDTTMTAATRTLEGLDAFARDFAGARSASPAPAVLDRFRDRMDDDLDAPGAVADLFVAMREARAAGNDAVAAAVLQLWEVALGLPLEEGSGQLPPEAQHKAAERDEARAARDWSRADQLRNELVADGYVVEDTPEGTRLRR